MSAPLPLDLHRRRLTLAELRRKESQAWEQAGRARLDGDMEAQELFIAIARAWAALVRVREGSVEYSKRDEL